MSLGILIGLESVECKPAVDARTPEEIAEGAARLAAERKARAESSLAKIARRARRKELAEARAAIHGPSLRKG